VTKFEILTKKKAAKSYKERPPAPRNTGSGKGTAWVPRKGGGGARFNINSSKGRENEGLAETRKRTLRHRNEGGNEKSGQTHRENLGG